MAPPEPRTERVSLFGLLATPLLWSGYFLAIYGFTSLACILGWADDRVLGVGLVAAVNFVLTVATVTGLAAIGIGGVDEWHKAGDGEGTRRFLGFMAAALSLLAVFATLWIGLPSMILPPCR